MSYVLESEIDSDKLRDDHLYLTPKYLRIMNLLAQKRQVSMIANLMDVSENLVKYTAKRTGFELKDLNI